ncbi:hypothetical protein HZA75_03210 [Candidatus Roizmanbacteria bacterium]|nr:hypothetical protein [Candidatus Roizmanbacteria bacterium]
MAKNLKRYYQAWELRQQGKKLREIAQIMGFKSGEWARNMVDYIDFRIRNKFPPISNGLKEIIKKYNIIYN